MKRSLVTLIFSLFVVGLLYLVYWFFSHFERVPIKVDVGYQGEARDNPFLAAQRLLERMGTPVEILSPWAVIDFEQLDLQETFILIERSAFFFTEEEAQQLLEWVDEGGHLIMTATHLQMAENDPLPLNNNPLLAELHISQYQNDLTPSEIEQASPTEVFWAPYHLKVDFNSNYYLEPKDYDPAQKISNEYGSHLLFYYYGAGMITVLSDLAFIENAHIAQYDHAQFLWQLIHFERIATKVWFLHIPTEEDMDSLPGRPNLWQQLWLNMRLIIISSAISLLSWLWFASRRFGPLLPVPIPARRRLLEHVEASGRFLWQQDQAPWLVERSQQALLKRLALNHPDWLSLPRQQLSQQLAHLCEFSTDEIDSILEGQSKPYTEFTFTRAIQILTTIRNKL